MDALTRADRASWTPAERAAWIARQLEARPPADPARAIGNVALAMAKRAPRVQQRPDLLTRIYTWEGRNPRRARAWRRQARNWILYFDNLELDALRRRCASGEAERDLAKWQAAKKALDEERAAARYRARVTRVPRKLETADPYERASAYLEVCDGGQLRAQRNPTAFGVVLRVVRGFGLGSAEAMRLLETEYAGRCRPPLKREELRGMVRRALAAPAPPWGYLLERNRR